MPTAQEIAAKALEAAQKAQHAAEIAQMTANNVITEMRQRFDRQDSESKEFRESLMAEIRKGNDTFDAFKSDFDKMDNRCRGHDDTIYGNKTKNLAGIVEVVKQAEAKVDVHDTWIARFLWTWAVVAFMATAAGWYLVYFYGDAMKRGIFNPTEEEQNRIINRQVSKWLPNQRWPDSAPRPTPTSTPGG